jgi:hypothetical protein
MPVPGNLQGRERERDPFIRNDFYNRVGSHRAPRRALRQRYCRHSAHMPSIARSLCHAVQKRPDTLHRCLFPFQAAPNLPPLPASHSKSPLRRGGACTMRLNPLTDPILFWVSAFSTQGTPLPTPDGAFPCPSPLIAVSVRLRLACQTLGEHRCSHRPTASKTHCPKTIGKKALHLRPPQ